YNDSALAIFATDLCRSVLIFHFCYLRKRNLHPVFSWNKQVTDVVDRTPAYTVEPCDQIKLPFVLEYHAGGFPRKSCAHCMVYILDIQPIRGQPGPVVSNGYLR